MNKTYLIALREFMENVRTKAFWIGILAFPLIIAACIVLGRVLDSAKDVRLYAVIDHSEGQWLSEEIDAAIQRKDLGRVFSAIDAETAPEIREKIDEQLEELPEESPLREVFGGFAQMQDEMLLQAVNGYAKAKAMVKLMGADQLMSQMQGIWEQWGQDPQQLKQAMDLFEGLSFEDYRRVRYDDMGDDPEGFLNDKLSDDELFAYFVIGEDPVHDRESSTYVSNNVTDNDLKRSYGRTATDIVQERYLAELRDTKDLTDDEAKLLNTRLDFDSKKVDEETGETEEVTKDEKAAQYAPIAFVYLLFISIMTATQMLLTNTIEEKSNRLIEVLLSSVSPLQLMAGKVFGIAATGLTVLLSWVVCALITVELLPIFLPGMDLDLAAIIGDPLYLASFVGYFLGGYFLYAAFFVGIGSVCNSLKEAQNLIQPVVLLLIVPLIAMFPVTNDPNGTLAIVLTYIPPFTPFLMMNRASAPPATWEYFASFVVIFISTAIAFWAAAKVFRIGILMTGKPPKIREIFGWLRAPVGAVHVRKGEGEGEAA